MSSDAAMITRPLTVSIVIPTHQRAGMVGVAIDSVLAQTDVDLEVIVVDDGSTDGTEAVVRGAFQESCVRYVWQPNAGRSAARNHGLALARGQFVGFLDSDDQLSLGALAAHLAVHAKHPGLGMTIGGYAVVDEYGVVVDERLPWLTGGSLDLAGWLFDCYGMPGSVLHRREWLERVGGFEAAFEIAEDWDLYLRMAKAGCGMCFVERVVCRYLQHGGNSIRDVELHWRASRRVVERLFTCGGLPMAVPPLERAVLTWVDVVAARRGFIGGAEEFARARLDEVLSRNPDLSASERGQALELLVAPMTGGRALETPVIRTIARGMEARPREMRAAISRAHMGIFFRMIQASNWSLARRALFEGIRRDPRWLFNRGVIKLGLRALYAELRHSPELRCDAS